MSQGRDVHGDYKAAYLEEHAAYVRAGRTKEADAVAEVLRRVYGVDVAPKKSERLETTEADAAPETTLAPTPKRRGRPPKPKPEPVE
jgi:hypothetical protein